MITTFADAYRADLPIEILRAQARISKIIIERGLPARLIRLCTYLVSTTSLKRQGRVYLSRQKVADLLGVSERTIDRHFDDLERHGVLRRLIRDRAPGGFFYGTCVRWSEAIWDALFVQPGRTRQQAVNELRRAQKEAALQPAELILSPEKSIAPLPNSSEKPMACAQVTPDSVCPQESKNTQETPPVHATFSSHYSSIPIPTVFNKSIFVNNESPTSQSATSTVKSKDGKRFTAPAAVNQWIKPLQLENNQVSMLMAVAKKTDALHTHTRLQDLLNHVGQRLIDGCILAERASKYLYRCLSSGEDYSSARFNAEQVSMREEDMEIAAAKALRKALPDGEIKAVGSMHLLRHDLVVYSVDPHVGVMGKSHKALTREQMAVIARRQGFVQSNQ